MFARELNVTTQSSTEVYRLVIISVIAQEGNRLRILTRHIKVWADHKSVEYCEFGRAKVKVFAIGMGTYYGIWWIATSHILCVQLGNSIC